MTGFAGENNEPRLLVIEDNSADVLLLRRVLRRARRPIGVQVATTAEAGLDILRTGTEDSPLPDLILTDLNLPKMHGVEFLATVKSDGNLQHIPVLVLSSSAAKCDIERCYDNSADGYFTKPLDSSGYDSILVCIETWLETVCPSMEPAPMRLAS